MAFYNLANARQNLIPLLCIRPMRILLSAESVRQARIVLLRATHLPFVALIWAYEASSGYATKHKQAHGGPASKVAAHTAAAEGPSFQGRIHRTAWHSEPPPGSRVSVIDEIDRLRTQVERVAAVANQQQEHANES